MKSLVLKSTLVVALALVGGYGIGYDASAHAATRPAGFAFQGLQPSGVPTVMRRPGRSGGSVADPLHSGGSLRGVRPGVRALGGPWPEAAADARRGEMFRFSARPTATHHRNITV